MRKVILIIMLFILCACENGNITTIPNPCVNYSRLQEAENVVGFNLDITTNEIGNFSLITVINKELLEVRDGDYYIRKKKLEYEEGIADISGVYIEYEDNLVRTIDDVEVITKGKDETIYVALWNKNDYAYSIYSKEGFSLETLDKLVKGIN